jgi:putative Mn2+ efflux pump MntP
MGLFSFTDINIFLLCIGIAFMVNYILIRDYSNKTSLIVGIVLILLSVRRVINLSAYTDTIIAVLLVVAGVVMIIKTLPKKREE